MSLLAAPAPTALCNSFTRWRCWKISVWRYCARTERLLTSWMRGASKAANVPLALQHGSHQSKQLSALALQKRSHAALNSLAVLVDSQHQSLKSTRAFVSRRVTGHRARILLCSKPTAPSHQSSSSPSSWSSESSAAAAAAGDAPIGLPPLPLAHLPGTTRGRGDPSGESGGSRGAGGGAAPTDHAAGPLPPQRRRQRPIQSPRRRSALLHRRSCLVPGVLAPVTPRCPIGVAGPIRVAVPLVPLVLPPAEPRPCGRRWEPWPRNHGPARRDCQKGGASAAASRVPRAASRVRVMI